MLRQPPFDHLPSSMLRRHLLWHFHRRCNRGAAARRQAGPHRRRIELHQSSQKEDKAKKFCCARSVSASVAVRMASPPAEHNRFSPGRCEGKEPQMNTDEHGWAVQIQELMKLPPDHRITRIRYPCSSVRPASPARGDLQ